MERDTVRDKDRDKTDTQTQVNGRKAELKTETGSHRQEQTVTDNLT